MDPSLNYQGKLLIAQPKCESAFFKESVILVVKHSNNGAWGVMLNKPIPDKSCDLADIYNHIGMDNPTGVTAPLYVGGPVERSRVCIIHSTDWASSSTIKVTEDVAVTTDISVLAAISIGQGPEKFRACCGISSWAMGQLEGEMSGREPWNHLHKWLDTKADAETVFDLEHTEQWSQLIVRAVRLEVGHWFS